MALWLGRQIIAARLSKSIEHEFNRKLELLKADLRATEERFKAQIREKEAEISALRGGALSVLASRQVALDKRRLEAVDQLWSAVAALAPARSISANMATIKFDAAAKESERNPKAREFFAMLGGNFDPKSMDTSGASKARPFLTPMVWAVFTAMQAIAMSAVIRWTTLKHGVGTTDYVDQEAVKKLILAVLPSYQDYLDRVGPDGFHFVLDALDSRLLEEIQKMLAGAEFDRASIEQSAEILKQANAIQTQLARGQVAA